MARLIGPDAGDRLAVRRGGGVAASAPVVVYANDSGSTLADILTEDGDAVAGSTLTTDEYGLIPLFQFPDGLVDTVYVEVQGGARSAVYARYDDRVDGIAARVASLESGSASGTALTAEATARAAADTAEATARAAADTAHAGAADPHTGYLKESDAAGTYRTVVNHGATAGTARPSGAAVVEWRGTVAPTNAQTDDLWLDKSASPAQLKRYTGSAFETVAGGSALPTGGTTTQALVKASNADGDVAWGNTAQISTSAAADLAATPAAGSTGQASDAGHVHRSMGLLSIFWGDGSDGAAVFDGTNTFAKASKSGSVYTLTSDMLLTSCTVDNGVTINTGGYRLWVRGTLTNNGIIRNIGGNASGATAGAQAPQGHFLYGRAGAAGGTGNGASASSWGDTWFPGDSATATGGKGGSGGASGANTAGTSVAPQGGSHAAELAHQFPIAFSGMATGNLPKAYATMMSGGGGGGAGAGDGTNNGGGGGGGGGALIVNARVLAGNGSFSCNGGNGGNAAGGNAAGGGGGGGGALIINTTASTFSGTYTANGGSAGTSSGTGTTPTASQAGLALLTVWS